MKHAVSLVPEPAHAGEKAGRDVATILRSVVCLNYSSNSENTPALICGQSIVPRRCIGIGPGFLDGVMECENFGSASVWAKRVMIYSVRGLECKGCIGNPPRPTSITII